MRLKDKIAIVTGGGQGIGRGIALMFAREGARVTIAQRTRERLEQTQQEIEGLGGQALAVPTDVSKEEDVQRMVAATQSRFGGLDILVNNAGTGSGGPVDEGDLADYQRVMDTNLKGMYLGCRFAVPLMKERGKGAIINISSVHGVQGAPGRSVYAATKGGIISCTRALAAELAAFNIRVNTISPGAIENRPRKAGMLSHIREEFQAEFLQRFGDLLDQYYRYYQPLEVVGKPEDIAYCAVYLGSDEARFVTGQNIVVDGGLTTYLSGHASERARKREPVPWEEIRAWIRAHAKEAEDK